MDDAFLFENALCGLLVCDAETGRILRANATFCEMAHWQPGALTRFRQLLTRPSLFVYNAQLLPQLTLNGEAREIALDLNGPGDSTIPVLVNARILQRPDQPAVTTYAVFPARDRREYEREQLRARRELTQYRDYLQLAEKLAHVGHWRTNLIDDTAYWSAEIYNILGRDPKTYVPQRGSAIDQYVDEDRAAVQKIVDTAVRHKSSFDFRKRIRRYNDGEIRIIQCSGICETDEAGQITGMFGVLHDMTDIVQTQSKLERSEARYRLLADQANDIITVFALDGRFDYVSPAIEAVLGYKPEELVGRNVRDIVIPEDFVRTQAAYAAYVTDGADRESPRIQYRAHHKNGHVVWLEAHPTAIFGANGRISRFQDVVRDITEQKATEAALARASLEANAAAEAKASFLATMSHELRTPLTSIIGFSALLRDLLDGQVDLKSHAARIHTSGQNLLSLINDILDHSRLDAGQLEIDPEPGDIIGLADEVVDLLRLQAEAKGLTLSLDVAADVPPIVMIDETRVRQILLNLAGNAIKFTEAGGVTVRLSMDGGRLQVAVRDTGIGIAPEAQRRLFQRFSQIDPDKGGTGLGLLICKQLVELMGGEIGVRSRMGQGSEFWFDIPAATAVDAPLPKTRTPGRILIVDDQAAVRELLVNLLGAAGHDVATAADGRAALEACARQTYDLIFMDINMPVMDGFAAAQGLRASKGPNARTPILGLTAAGGEDRRRACLNAGMDDMLTKPLSPSSLALSVARWIHEAPAAGRRVG